jgi:putative MATE family efflux protein
MGNSKIPFYLNSIGLVINIGLDPLLIFKFNMGSDGAGYATVISQAVVTLLFIVLFRSKKAPFEEFHFFKAPILSVQKQIFKFGYPVGLQSGLFTVFASLIAKVVAQWGPIPIAVQKVGSQIEALSWMTASGFSTALSSFVGQNYGAKKWERISQGYFTTIALSGTIGIFASILLIFFSEPLFLIFIPNDPEALRVGVDYLRILGFSQLFMCLEITSQGAFNGLGKTLPPSLVSILFTGLRVPGAIILSTTILELNGVWWSISASSIFKGVVLASWFVILLVRHPDVCGPKRVTQLIFKFDRRAWRDKRCLGGRADIN